MYSWFGLFASCSQITHVLKFSIIIMYSTNIEVLESVIYMHGRKNSKKKQTSWSKLEIIAEHTAKIVFIQLFLAFFAIQIMFSIFSKFENNLKLSETVGEGNMNHVRSIVFTHRFKTNGYH
jgi:hypothetical protein